MSNENSGALILRKENIQSEVTGFALQEYVLKQLLVERSGSADSESYYQENSADPTAQGTRTIEDIGRLSQFPSTKTSWNKKRTYIKKYGGEDEISIEDISTNNISVLARTQLRIARAITKAVDDDIFDTITENRSAVNINSVSITAGNEWDATIEANRDPIYDILQAIQKIEENNYKIRDGGGFLLVNPKQYTNLMRNTKISNNPSWQVLSDAQNGRVARLLNLTVLVSNSVTADYAAVVKAKEVGDWVTVDPLTVVTIDEPGIKVTIRAWERGAPMLINPKAVTLISNTDA